MSWRGVSCVILLELHGALVLRQQPRGGLELGDDVVAGVALLDWKRQRSLAPMRDVGDGAFAVLGQEGVELLEFLGDRRLFQDTIEDVDRLVPTRHVTSLWS